MTISDSKAEPATYFDTEELIFYFESEDDLSLAGSSTMDYTITIVGEIGTSIILSKSAQFNLRVINPCALIVPEQESPPEYLYTGAEPILEFTPEAIELDPPICPLTFECKIVSGPRLDLCEVDEGTSVGGFDERTGQFTFQSSDAARFEPGLYVMEIKVKSGMLEEAFTVDLNFVQPEDGPFDE